MAGVVSFHGGMLDGAGEKAPSCDGVAALIHNGDDDASVTDEEIDSMRVRIDHLNSPHIHSFN